MFTARVWDFDLLFCRYRTKTEAHLLIELTLCAILLGSDKNEVTTSGVAFMQQRDLSITSTHAFRISRLISWLFFIISFDFFTCI